MTKIAHISNFKIAFTGFNLIYNFKYFKVLTIQLCKLSFTKGKKLKWLGQVSLTVLNWIFNCQSDEYSIFKKTVFYQSGYIPVYENIAYKETYV